MLPAGHDSIEHVKTGFAHTVDAIHQDNGIVDYDAAQSHQADETHDRKVVAGDGQADHCAYDGQRKRREDGKRLGNGVELGNQQGKNENGGHDIGQSQGFKRLGGFLEFAGIIEGIVWEQFHLFQFLHQFLGDLHGGPPLVVGRDSDDPAPVGMPDTVQTFSLVITGDGGQGDQISRIGTHLHLVQHSRAGPRFGGKAQLEVVFFGYI